MNHEEDNRNKIADAFARLAVNSMTSFVKGLEELLDYGVQMCLEHHNPEHQRHLETGNSYGWIILYNGSEIKRKIFAEGAPAIGNANSAIDNLVTKYGDSAGYVGLVVAGMLVQGEKKPTYFNWHYEFGPMRATIRDIKSMNFQQVFRPIN